MDAQVFANGQAYQVSLPCTVHDFLLQIQMLPRSVVVELSGVAISPSEFTQRQLQSGDRLEIVRIVAGG